MKEKDKKQNQTAEEPKGIHRRRFKGVVISDKMDKTVVVKVDTIRQHPKYKKRYYVSRKFKVHDERNQFREDDQVDFIECRPLSKGKRWRVIYDNK
jgi:small subunit ribosomal protein S17